MEKIRLTQYSHGAGCGCKISPAVLDKILHSESPKQSFPALLVGNESKDDAAVYEMENGQCIISTTDFFMPIVDDPATFGAIASVNAISDVYAMGGEPLLAIAILGWPINTIPPEVAQAVLEGSRTVCSKAGIPLAGGHSIDCPEPVFGLAVTGRVEKANLKKNNTARPGSWLYLTKPLGIGIATTAQKKGVVNDQDYTTAVNTMLMLNDFGKKAGTLSYVNAMTDVTGFGLLGHLCEMCEGSSLSAEIEFLAVPRFSFLDRYIEQKAIPGGTTRNWESYGQKVMLEKESMKAVLADPQTSGGLLVSVDAEKQSEFEEFARQHRLDLRPLGKLVEKKEKAIYVR
jgi:selenide, water dikinase